MRWRMRTDEGRVRDNYPAPRRAIKGQAPGGRAGKIRLQPWRQVGLYLPTMLQPQVERALITMGILLCGAGALAVAAGAWSASSGRQFQATAVRTTATVIPSG